MRTLAIVVILLLVAFIPLSWRSSSSIRVGSKKFTESVILGEMTKLLAEVSSATALHYRELGGTQPVFQAPRNGDIDVYPEYTGTIAEEILATEVVDSEDSMRAALQQRGVMMSRPLGFNNSYALGMLRSRASELGIESISDLLRHPELKFGFSNEFIDREDGWRKLQRDLGVTVEIKEENAWQRILNRTIEHLDLVRRSLIPAILCAIPLGIVAAKRRRLGQLVLAVVGITQTIPSLALLVMLMPAVAAIGFLSVGLGSTTAVTALFLYSLLPIVRNTHSGLQGISSENHEAALALGLPARFRLTQIELPLASRSILAGIKTAAVMNVGFATLGALIGAGGYGQPIITGIRLNDTSLILQGAIPAALLALAVQGGFEISERLLVPKGLRLERE